MRKLYYHALCTNSRMAMFALAEKRLDFSITPIRFWDPKSGLDKLNNFKRLPVLIEINGTKVAGIFALLEYLDETYEEFAILGMSAEERAEARRIFQWAYEDLAPEITNILAFEKGMKRYFVKDSSPSSSVLKDIQRKSDPYFQQIEWFSERRTWLAGSVFSIADIAIAANISLIDYFGHIGWERYPLLKEWYVRIKSRPSFQLLLKDKIPGINPVSYYSNPDF